MMDFYFFNLFNKRIAPLELVAFGCRLHELDGQRLLCVKLNES